MKKDKTFIQLKHYGYHLSILLATLIWAHSNNNSGFMHLNTYVNGCQIM